jgi:cob(I)alamin adenosyltransferase
MVYINKVYTRFGDQGDTMLASGDTVAKDSLRVASYGEVDELNATIGLLRIEVSRAQAARSVTSRPSSPTSTSASRRIQQELFDLGAELAEPNAATFAAPDAATFAAPDAATFAAPDAATFAAPDAATFAAPDAATFAAPDAATSRPPDAATFAAPDAATFAAPDAATFAAPDAATVASRRVAVSTGKARLCVTDEDITRLEHELDALNDPLPPLRSFILPGGGRSAPLPTSRAPCVAGPSARLSLSPAASPSAARRSATSTA